MRIYIGTDHGKNGALVAMSEKGKVLDILPMPKKQDGSIDCFQVYSWLYENYGDYEHEVVAVGEKLHAIFRVAASNTFEFGKNIGKIVGIIECLEMEYQEVRAVDWQKYLFTKYEVPEISQKKLTKSGKKKRDTKAMALHLASVLYPEVAQNYATKDGVVDALLIARYAQEKKL